MCSGLFKYLFLSAVFFTSSFSTAASYQASISDESFGVGMYFDAIAENLSADIHWIHADNFDLLRLGVYMSDVASEFEFMEEKSLGIKMGAKGFMLNTDYDDGSGVAIGGELEYLLSETLSVYADLYYASGKLSFEDVDSYQERSIGVRAKIIKNGVLSIGYGVVEVDFDSVSNVDLEDGFLIEMAMEF